MNVFERRWTLKFHSIKFHHKKLKFVYIPVRENPIMKEDKNPIIPLLFIFLGWNIMKDVELYVVYILYVLYDAVKANC